MGAWKWLKKVSRMRQFRGEVLGKLVEIRVGVWGNQTVLVDGGVVSEKAWAGLTGAMSHFFTLTDEEGKQRNVEVKMVDRSGGLQMSLRAEVLVDGRVFKQILEIGEDEAAGRCPNCGYQLKGLDVVNGEIRCPECGRHTGEDLIR